MKPKNLTLSGSVTLEDLWGVHWDDTWVPTLDDTVPGENSSKGSVPYFTEQKGLVPSYRFFFLHLIYDRGQRKEVRESGEVEGDGS